MNKLSQIRSIEQIQIERRRLEQIVFFKEQALGRGIQGFQNNWQSRWKRLRWVGTLAGFVASNVGRKTLLSTIATKIIQRMWTLYKHRK